MRMGPSGGTSSFTMPVSLHHYGINYLECICTV